MSTIINHIRSGHHATKSVRMSSDNQPSSQPSLIKLSRQGVRFWSFRTRDLKMRCNARAISCMMENCSHYCAAENKPADNSSESENYLCGESEKFRIEKSSYFRQQL